MRKVTRRSYREAMTRIINRTGVTLLLVVCCSCSLFSNENSLRKQAKAYVDEVLPGIVTYWDSKQLLWNSHPEFVKTTSAEQLTQLFFAFMKLGPLKKYDESQGRVSISKLTVNGQTNLFCDYVTQLDFENASAKISVRVIKVEGKWDSPPSTWNQIASKPTTKGCGTGGEQSEGRTCFQRTIRGTCSKAAFEQCYAVDGGCR